MLKKLLRHVRMLLIIGSGISLLAAGPAFAVTTCEALTLYGNAAASGLCGTLSPGTQNLWVCELATSPDVHTTFNLTTALHITVRIVNNVDPEKSCEGSSALAGAWPLNLAIAPAQPVTVCGVNVSTYVTRLKAVLQTNGCVASFTAAQTRITPAVATSYSDLCRASHCP